MTPRLRTEVDGWITLPENDKESAVTLALCCVVPTRRYSVLEGLSDR